MNKYKLIKKYPGSPELGTIINYSEKHKVYNYNGGDYHTELPKHQVENLPEYWEKVEEKDYEIIAFKNTANDIICEKCNDGSFTSCGNEFGLGNTEHFLSKTRHKIYSVKRLSDGEVFTIGDEVIVGSRNGPQTIKQFELDKSSIRFRFNDGCGALLKWFSDPKDIQHAKEPLFTTEGGIDIYEGDEFYITTNYGDGTSKRIGGDGLQYQDESVRKRCYSSKKAIEEHKPKYSKKDIKKAISNSKLSIPGEYLHKSQLEYELDLN